MGTQTRKLLYVVDRRDIFDFVQSMMSVMGYEVEWARTSDSAMSAAAERTFDLYLLDDWWLADRTYTGEDVCRSLRNLHPKIPILICSTTTDPRAARRLLGAGADDYVRLPDLGGVHPQRFAALIDAGDQRKVPL
jgi:DNA-binding response OmpR family regulator